MPHVVANQVSFFNSFIFREKAFEADADPKAHSAIAWLTMRFRKQFLDKIFSAF